jgi:hypothetical protein
MSLYCSLANDFLAVTGLSSATILNKSLEPYGRFYDHACKVKSACIDEKLARLYICTSLGISMIDYKTLYKQS